MSAQTKSYKREIVENYVKEHDPYHFVPLEFDLRGYADYIKRNNLSVEDLTPEVMNTLEIKFKKK